MFKKILEYILLMLPTLIVIGLIGMCTFCWIKFGGSSITEIPSWALWFMFGGK